VLQESPSPIIPIRQGQTPPPGWYDETFRDFVRDYAKGVPLSLRARWPDYCPDEATWREIQDGLAHWCKSAKWVDDGNDWVTKPEKRLAERLNLKRPRLSNRFLAPEMQQSESARATRSTLEDRMEESRRLAREGNPALRSLMGDAPLIPDAPDRSGALDAHYTVRRSAR
jgi:hypothetical protein